VLSVRAVENLELTYVLARMYKCIVTNFTLMPVCRFDTVGDLKK